MKDRLLSYIGLDGMAHMIVSVVMLLVLQIFLPWYWAIGITLSIGKVKEVVWDWLLKNGTPQWKDIICDIVGIAIGCLTFI